MFKKILLAFLALILFAVVLIGGVVLYNMRDVALKPEAEAFFAPDPFDPTDNFHVHWAGIHAPEGVDDLFAYGLERVELDVDYEDSNALRFNDGGVDWNQFCFKQSDFRTRDDCDQGEVLQVLLDQNRTLLNRYRDLYRQQGLVVSVGGKLGVPGTYGQDIISLHQLSVLRWSKMAKNGQAYESIDEWIASMRNMQSVINGKMTMVGHAIWMIVYRVSVDALPLILSEDISVLETRGDEIKALLRVDYMEQWGVLNMELADVNAVNILLKMPDAKDHLFFKVNDTKNKFYAMSQDRIKFSELSYEEMSDQAITDFNMQHDLCYDGFDFGCMGYNYITNMMMGGLMKGTQLFRNGRIMTARQRALLLWIDAREKGVPVDDMLEFVSQADPSLYNSLYDEPFKWDEDNHSIYYTIKYVEEPYQKREVYYP